jgi:light-regulated signal transduction histidine kinase (bacteriophytochrome)
MPGAILPHGAMLVIDADTFEILQAGGDTAALLGASANELLCTNLAMLFRPRPLARLRTICNLYPLLKPRHLFTLTLRAKQSALLDVSAHRSDGFLVLEFEAAPGADRRSVDPLRCVQDMIEGLDTRGSLQTLCQLAAERVHSVSGFDRVMIYRFLDDDSGWVFAESREEGLDPFLDLHFPAAAIPQRRRALYLERNVRLLRHVDDEPSPLIPPLNPRTHRPLDISRAILRDVSLLDREYLRNMGVEAAMSISITSEGKLWGLITCHHYSARHFPRYLRSICEIFSSMFSLQLEAHQRAEMLEARLIEDAARSQARAQELLLLTELDHRIKDTVANTQALVLQSSRSTRLLRGLTQSLDHRIYAMDKAHRLLTERRWEGVSIADLLHEEFDAHRRDLGRVALSGPDVVLTPQAALAMSLAFHELCMNAAKYGSLSLPGGRVSIRWHMTEAGGVDLSWQEADGPLVGPPQQRGFGSNIIEQALAMETGGHSTLKFGRGGVTCTVVLPMSSIVSMESIPVDT